MAGPLRMLKTAIGNIAGLHGGDLLICIVS